MKNEPKENEKERTKEKGKENPTTTTTACENFLMLSGAPVRARSVLDAAGKIGMPIGEAREWVRYMHQVGWRFANGNPLDGRNFRRSLRMWHKIDLREAAKRSASLSGAAFRLAGRAIAREKAEAKRRAEEAKRRAETAASEEGWKLCAEECVHCDGIGCRRGVRIPPAHQSWPKPPRECAAFEAKEMRK